MKKRAEDYGIKIGRLPRGRLNKISDVEGVLVGHATIDQGDYRTGVTTIIPSQANIYRYNLVAASHVINGFGKTAGLVQINELGLMESIIGLTNTLNLGIVHDALVDYTIGQAKEEGLELTSFNPLVAECNDSFLNKIQERTVTKDHVYRAIADARADFEEGDVGAGKGMSCHELKGGLGSASRLMKIGGENYCLGALVLSNYGLMEDLIIDGKKVGVQLKELIQAQTRKEEGSIIIILATDLPVDSRQLARICKRATVGLARLGSNINHGSGDIVIGFSTANIVDREGEGDFIASRILREERLNLAFRAATEATEEAILNSMLQSEKLVGYRGNTRESLKDYIERLI